jgi:hypothetical protein
MSNLITIIGVLAAAGAIFLKQRMSLADVHNANNQLASQSSVLHTRAGEWAQRQAILQRQLAESEDMQRQLQEKQTTVPSPNTEQIVAPDTTRKGGWPTNALYFYLPKKDLGSLGYHLLEGNRLTDDATLLFGMTAADREAVEAAYDQMWRRFRELEIQRMEPAETPKKWTHMQDSISYRIPTLESEARALRAGFESSLQQTLGATRAKYLSEAADDFLSRNLDDLGQHARIISFGIVHQPTGEVQRIYGILDEATGVGNARTFTELEADWPISYYARLFGIDVPIKSESSVIDKSGRHAGF